MAQFGDFTVDRNSTKYVLGSGGTIISYATDEPAFEFNADGSYKGLLVEPAATNLVTYSEDFTDASWNTTTGSELADQATSPDGNVSADTLVEPNSGTSRYEAFYTSNVVSGTSYTFSVFAKEVQSSPKRYLFLATGSSKFGSQAVYGFDLSDGSNTYDNGNGDGFTVENYGNGWYRISISDTATGTGGNSFIIYGSDSPTSSANYTCSGESIAYVWGAQVETGPIATSYIPTSGSTVTRVKDQIALESASSLIGQTEGTIYIEVDWRLATGTTQNLLNLNDGTGSNRFFIQKTTANFLIMFAQANSVVLTSQGVDSSGFSGIQKIAFAYADSDFELYRNGSSISSDTSGSLAALATLTDIDLGQNRDASAQANMHIRAFALYPKRLSDAEAQALTTL